jgi:NAD(P)-dependent dehydrogenase (short-subunit alcohol dehydrogenase family)
MPCGVRANIVLPRTVRTPTWERAQLGRIVALDEVARVFAFLVPARQAPRERARHSL